MRFCPPPLAAGGRPGEERPAGPVRVGRRRTSSTGRPRSPVDLHAGGRVEGPASKPVRPPRGPSTPLDPNAGGLVPARDAGGRGADAHTVVGPSAASAGLAAAEGPAAPARAVRRRTLDVMEGSRSLGAVHGRSRRGPGRTARGGRLPPDPPGRIAARRSSARGRVSSRARSARRRADVAAVTRCRRGSGGLGRGSAGGVVRGVRHLVCRHPRSGAVRARDRRPARERCGRPTGGGAAAPAPEAPWAR